jgi:DNA-binding response OmpR family regulator
MKKILLIEDNTDIRENTAEILELANYSVTTAADGKAGVEAALANRPDLIICDIMMPVLDGYGVLHLLNKHAEMQGIPFIFLSAKSERDDVRRGMDLGADDYITKPFDGTELLRAVETRLKKAEQLSKELDAGIKGVSQLAAITNSKQLLDALHSGRNINRYKKKQLIYSEGNHPSRLYFIQKGKVKTYKTNDDGKELTVGLYGEGEFLGHVALLQGCTYKENAEAIDDTEIAIIPKEDFYELLNSSMEVSRKFISLLASNLTEKEDQLLRMAYNSLRKKVADSLLMLHRKYQSAIDISRENMATIAGTATESMIRTLGDFKSEKLIDIKDGCIYILNEKKLENLVN